MKKILAIDAHNLVFDWSGYSMTLLHGRTDPHSVPTVLIVEEEDERTETDNS